jgi:GDPmannose 4,6-dehydratase
VKKSALITGITGQDGSYLAELLLDKGYIVHGLKRRASQFNTDRIDHLAERNIHLHYADLTDTVSINAVVSEVAPDEIYNLGAQSHVAVSFETPEYTANADALGTLRLLESIRITGLAEQTRFYQASTSELFGKVVESPQTEDTPFQPQSPYAVSKLFSYWSTVNYRNSYNIYACNGILFNHESPRRGPTFVTRKITMGLARIITSDDAPPLQLGNIYALRDWGHARDYVDAMWRMLQLEQPIDLIIGTGQQYSVKEFIEICANLLDLQLVWTGIGLDEVASCALTARPIVTINQKYFRPLEVDTLLADASKARDALGWQPSTTLLELANEMLEYDLKHADWHAQKPYA